MSLPSPGHCRSSGERTAASPVKATRAALGRGDAHGYNTRRAGSPGRGPIRHPSPAAGRRRDHRGGGHRRPARATGHAHRRNEDLRTAGGARPRHRSHHAAGGARAGQRRERGGGLAGAGRVGGPGHAEQPGRQPGRAAALPLPGRLGHRPPAGGGAGDHRLRRGATAGFAAAAARRGGGGDPPGSAGRRRPARRPLRHDQCQLPPRGGAGSGAVAGRAGRDGRHLQPQRVPGGTIHRGWIGHHPGHADPG